MPPERPVVRDLDAALDLIPQARGTDSFARPAATRFGPPPKTNPLMQLSDALSALEPRLQQTARIFARDEIEFHAGEAAKTHLEHRDVWAQHTRNGTIPVGANPFFIKELHRLQLTDLGREYQTEMHNAFYGKEGALARESDNPAEVSKLIGVIQERFVNTKLKNEKGQFLYSGLDLQEVFLPAAEQASKQMQRTHAVHRVKQREEDAELLGGKYVTELLDAVHLNTTEYASNTDRTQVLSSYGEAINEFYKRLYRNGYNPTKGNALIVESVVAKAIETGNRDILDVLDHIKTKGGVLGKTKDAVTKRTAAEEHITSKVIQAEHFEEFMQNRWFRQLQQDRTLQSYQREDARYIEEQNRLKRDEGERAADLLVKTYENRIFDGLRRPDGDKVIEDAMRQLELLDTDAAIRMKNAVRTIMASKADYPDDPGVLAQIRLDMLKDPTSFNMQRLVDAVGQRTIKTSTFLQLADDLSKERTQGEDPFLRQAGYTKLLNLVQTGAMKGSEGTPASTERSVIAAEAIGAFRDEALAWKQANPNGTLQQFNVYMRSRVKEVLEQADPEFKKENDQATRREFEKRQVLLAEREQDRLDAEDARLEAERKARKNQPEAKGKTPKAKPQTKTSANIPAKIKELIDTLTKEQKVELVDLKREVTDHHSEDRLRKRVLDIFRPIYTKNNRPINELTKDVNAFMSTFLNKKKKPS